MIEEKLEWKADPSAKESWEGIFTPNKESLLLGRARGFPVYEFLFCVSKHREFLSYSRQNQPVVELVARMVEADGVDAMWYRDLKAGLPFNDQIRAFIEHAHVFTPVISRESAESVWVHAEIGYALALRIPVLPICLGGYPPGEMIQQVQAVALTSDPADEAALIAEAAAKLTAAEIE
ncbi:MAG: toll/interleukin-1 receptor domain-containing protein [Verrucomicrobiae bacterium]|nr:toll/interleukin-1 receptor domain-containing protein [Verrucomicrobiae bacterium]MCB1090048.1 toll/interleukin-1 receptor domain-containing protein [Verrucomicrobiae bacterium]